MTRLTTPQKLALLRLVNKGGSDQVWNHTYTVWTNLSAAGLVVRGRVSGAWREITITDAGRAALETVEMSDPEDI